jgi:lipopolysaccharide/colanic/teichoic acid biosynthesis glycosyltransferase
MQRFFDILFSGLAILILSPIFILISILLRFTGEGEIFFLQERVGKNMKMIKLYKFATMVKNSENIGTGTVTLHNDPRILPLGSILRKTKINELPQLINIFKGDMSVIGPRPQTLRCFKAFPEELHEVITKVRPGLSGIGSIVFRDEEELMNDSNNADELYDQIIMPYKANLEKWYITHNSLSMYFSLIFLTIWTVIFSKTKLIWKFYKSLPRPPISLIDKI